MIKLSEWNQVIDYAKEITRSTLYKRDGKQIFIDIRSSVYTMYDDRKGIYLTTYDKEDKPHEKYASGIHETFEQYKAALDKMLQTIVNEY